MTREENNQTAVDVTCLLSRWTRNTHHALTALTHELILTELTASPSVFRRARAGEVTVTIDTCGAVKTRFTGTVVGHCNTQYETSYAAIVRLV